MLVDFSDEIKLGGEPKPIMVDLSDEKKQPWMFTLDGLILWMAASSLGRRPHSLDGGPLDGGPLDGGLILF